MSTKKDEYGTCWRHNLATIGRDGCLSSCLCVCLSCPHPPGIVCTQSANGNKSGDAENLTPAVADRRRQPNRQIRRGKMKTMNGSCGSWHRLMTYQRIKSSVAAKHVHIITETCVRVCPSTLLHWGEISAIVGSMHTMLFPSVWTADCDLGGFDLRNT